MISRRDNLLKRPWEQKKYENHRRKVQSALPAIDNSEPTARMHVLIKLKKHQKEKEKHQQIERENFLLLRNLSYIMRSNRVDNSWSTPQPSFLNRVTMYGNNPKQKEAEEIESKSQEKGRRGKCFACTPHVLQKIKTPEERIPWEPEKLPVSRKIRCQSVPTIKEHVETKESPPQERLKSCKARSKKKESDRKGKPLESPTRIILQSGSFNLAVNVPFDTTVKMYDKKSCKILHGRNCFCKHFLTTKFN